MATIPNELATRFYDDLFRDVDRFRDVASPPSLTAEDFYSAVARVEAYAPRDPYTVSYDDMAWQFRNTWNMWPGPNAMSRLSGLTADSGPATVPQATDEPDEPETPMPQPLPNCHCPQCMNARSPSGRPSYGMNFVESHRNQQTRTVIEQFTTSDYSSRQHAVYCTLHNRTHYVNTVEDRRRMAANPRDWCGPCAHKGTRPSSTAKPKGMDRRYGIEFEFLGLSEEKVMDLLQQAGIKVVYRDEEGWDVKEDGSLYGNGDYGCEVASPILQGEEGLAEVRKVLEALRTAGAYTNDSCGVHVHLEADDLNVDQIGQFVRSYLNNHDFIDWLVTPNRRQLDDGNDDYYAIRLDEECVTTVERARTKTDMYDGDRYRTVNVNSYSKFGTIELRQYQGTLSYAETEAWLRFCQGLMDAVVANGAPLTKSMGLKSFMDNLPVDDEAKAYLLGRALTFNGAPNIVMV
jgi:hypothetical protein